MSVVRRFVRRGGSTNRWLASLVVRKLRMVSAVVLANKKARPTESGLVANPCEVLLRGTL